MFSFVGPLLVSGISCHIPPVQSRLGMVERLAAERGNSDAYSCRVNIYPRLIVQLLSIREQLFFVKRIQLRPFHTRSSSLAISI